MEVTAGIYMDPNASHGCQYSRYSSDCNLLVVHYQKALPVSTCFPSYQDKADYWDSNH